MNKINLGLILLLCLAFNRLLAQKSIEQSLYYHKDLAPTDLPLGHKLLDSGVVINNTLSETKVSFELSTDGRQWYKFALDGQHCALYNLNGYTGCYVRYSFFNKEKKFKLNAAACYAFIFIVSTSDLDLGEVACKRKTKGKQSP